MAASTALPLPGSAPVPSQSRAPHGNAGGAEVVTSSALLRGRPYVQIEHNGALYQLRATKLGKLILTK